MAYRDGTPQRPGVKSSCTGLQGHCQDVSEQETRGHEAAGAVNLLIRSQRHAKKVGQETKMRSKEYWPHVGEAENSRSGSEGGRDCTTVVAQTQHVAANVDGVDEDRQDGIGAEPCVASDCIAVMEVPEQKRPCVHGEASQMRCQVRNQEDGKERSKEGDRIYDCRLHVWNHKGKVLSRGKRLGRGTPSASRGGHGISLDIHSGLAWPRKKPQR